MRLRAFSVLLAACASPPPEVVVHVGVGSPVAEVSDRFLSVAVDTAEVVGGKFWDPAGGQDPVPVAPYDFGRPRLRALAAALAPAYLRIGGTDADRTHIDLSAAPSPTPPAGFEWVLTKAEWDGAVSFASDLGFQILFTIDAGAGPRTPDGAWHADDVTPLLQLAASRQDPVAAWELGNEVGAYSLTLPGVNVSPAQYGADLAAARAAVTGALLAGPASAYWPKVGEVISFLPAALTAGGADLDVVSWHYYPQESRRCPLAVRRAGLDVMMDPANLDDVRTWIAQVDAARASSAPGAQIWLDETGNAQCGGEPGVSDAFAGTFWWLDELGTVARAGVPVVVRQTLSGSDYGLIDDATLTPNPDYWASLLWRRLVGTRVLDVSVLAANDRVRAYAACAAGGGGATLLAINLSAAETVRVRAPELDGSSSERYRVTASGLDAREVMLEGAPLALAADGSLPALAPAPGGGSAEVELPPQSWAFLVVHGAAPDACP
jgi:heparanase 1